MVAPHWPLFLRQMWLGRSSGPRGLQPVCFFSLGLSKAGGVGGGREIGSDPSHSRYRYTGRSGVGGRGSNNIAFLGFGVLSARGAQGD